MRAITICILVAMAVAFCATGAFAASSQTVSLNATVPVAAGGLTLTISKVTGGVFSADTGINFGTLVWDTTNQIFTAGSYYALDVAVTDNSGAFWTLTHTRNSLMKDTANNLDNNVNVTFAKETLSGSTTTETVLQKISYINSNNVAYTKTQLTGGWLRMYYGIGTGSSDATGVIPIGATQVAGAYSGSITLTLTP
jgi:hypothetical protein